MLQGGAHVQFPARWSLSCLGLVASSAPQQAGPEPFLTAINPDAHFFLSRASKSSRTISAMVRHQGQGRPASVSPPFSHRAGARESNQAGSGLGLASHHRVTWCDEPNVEAEGNRFGKTDPFEIRVSGIQEVIQFADNDGGNSQG